MEKAAVGCLAATHGGQPLWDYFNCQALASGTTELLGSQLGVREENSIVAVLKDPGEGNSRSE